MFLLVLDNCSIYLKESCPKTYVVTHAVSLFQCFRLQVLLELESPHPELVMHSVKQPDFTCGSSKSGVHRLRQTQVIWNAKAAPCNYSFLKYIYTQAVSLILVLSANFTKVRYTFCPLYFHNEWFFNPALFLLMQCIRVLFLFSQIFFFKKKEWNALALTWKLQEIELDYRPPNKNSGPPRDLYHVWLSVISRTYWVWSKSFDHWGLPGQSDGRKYRN